MKGTVFERYGGFGSVSRVVSSMYDKILDSPVTGSYFAGTDMRRLIDHQTRFIATLMGGPASYTNEHLERIHAHIGITNAAFDEVCLLLRETLEEFGFEDADIGTVEQEILNRRPYIVSRS